MPLADGFLGSDLQVLGQTKPGPLLRRVTRELRGATGQPEARGGSLSKHQKWGPWGRIGSEEQAAALLPPLFSQYCFLDWPGLWCPGHREQWSEVLLPHLGEQVYPDMGVARVQPSVSIAYDTDFC